MVNLEKNKKIGMMEGIIKEVGKMENNTEMENSFKIRLVYGEKDYGMKEKELNGLMRIKIVIIILKHLDWEFRLF